MTDNVHPVHINNPAAPLYPPERKLTERGFAKYGSLTDTYGTDLTVQQSSAVEPRVWVSVAPNPDMAAIPGSALHLSPDNARWLRERLGEWLDDIEEPRDVPHGCGLCDGPLRHLGNEAGIPAWKCDACGWEHTSKDCCVPIVGVEPIDVVFDGPPSHESGRFIEVEDALGHSRDVGEWVERPDGNWALRIDIPIRKGA